MSDVSNFPAFSSFVPSSQALMPNTFSPRETQEEAKQRFEIECEFVQALANPHYLNYLAQRGYFKEQYFVNYLKYLLYFKHPEYSRTLKYPQCLFFLEALQGAEFREAMASSANASYIEDQQLLQWHLYARKRQRLQEGMRVTERNVLLFAVASFMRALVTRGRLEIDDQNYMPSRCESCLVFVNEIESILMKAPKSMAKAELEATLIDELEMVCKRMLDYRLHKDKAGLARFSKEASPTSKLIKKLKAQGVEVKLDMPSDLLDQPSAESGRLKTDCEWIVEEFEEELRMWFLSHRHERVLRDYLCKSVSKIGCAADEAVKGGDLRRNEL